MNIQLPPSCRGKEPLFYTVKLHECIAGESGMDADAHKSTYTDAKEKRLIILKCRHCCTKDAKMVDSRFPLLNYHTACEECAKKLFNVIIEE